MCFEDDIYSIGSTVTSSSSSESEPEERRKVSTTSRKYSSNIPPSKKDASVLDFCFASASTSFKRPNPPKKKQKQQPIEESSSSSSSEESSSSSSEDSPIEEEEEHHVFYDPKIHSESETTGSSGDDGLSGFKKECRKESGQHLKRDRSVKSLPISQKIFFQTFATEQKKKKKKNDDLIDDLETDIQICIASGDEDALLSSTIEKQMHRFPKKSKPRKFLKELIKSKPRIDQIETFLHDLLTLKDPMYETLIFQLTFIHSKFQTLKPSKHKPKKSSLYF